MVVVYQVRCPSVSGTGADWRNLELSPLPLSNDRYILNKRRYYQPRELCHSTIENVVEPRIHQMNVLIFRQQLRTKWDGTLPLCIGNAYNWYLLEAYDLRNMLDTFIGVWKCVEKNLEPFWWKNSLFWRRHEKIPTDPQIRKMSDFLIFFDADEVGRYATSIHPTRI